MNMSEDTEMRKNDARDRNQARREAKEALRLARHQKREEQRQKRKEARDVKNTSGDTAVFSIVNPMCQYRPIKLQKPSKPSKPQKPQKPTKPTPSAPAPVPVKYGLKKTLLIGINYVQDPNNQLQGCINDVLNIRNKLVSVYPQCNTHKALTDTDPNAQNKPTRANILAGIQWLLSGLVPGDAIYMHYSGHGGLVKDANGDEVSGKDSCIFPINNGKIETITDDEIRSALVNKIPAGVKAFIVFDCCHSGSALDLRYNYVAPSRNGITMTQNGTYTKTVGSVVYLSGCRDTQTAADTVDLNGKPSGALTNALLDVWKTYGVNIQFKYLLWDIQQSLSKSGYTQIPQLSCGSDIDLNAVFNLG